MNDFDFLMLDMPEDIKKYLAYGNFENANRLIDIYLGRNITQKLKARLEYEKEVIKRLEKEYTYNYSQILDIFMDNIYDFTKKELDYLRDERYVDWIFINGEPMFHHRALENTSKVNPAIRNRLKTPYHENEMEAYTKSVVENIIETGQASYHIKVKKGLMMKDDFFLPNKKLSVHLPLPKEARNMTNISIDRFSMKPKKIAPVSAPQRTAYFEESLNYNIPFSLDFSFDSTVTYRELDYRKVSKSQPSFYLDEYSPHIRFTPYLVDLAHSIVKDAENPLKKARLIYNYITQNIQYSFMRNYGCLDNIPEFAAYNLKGDCGLQALLFITLCRIVDVPSRWQSGLVCNPYRLGAHDWAEFYIEPYGWLYADLSFGGMSLRLGEPKLWNYYFGHIDPFRLVFNSSIQEDFIPPNRFLREDPYDNQHGEMEYEDRPIYSNEYKIISEIIKIEKIN